MRWFRNLNLLPKLLLAGLASVVIIVILEILPLSYFWKQDRIASEERRISFSIHIGMLKALIDQKDFLLTDIKSNSFQQTGTSRALEKHRLEMAGLKRNIEALANISSPEERADIETLRNFAATYEQAFEQMVQEYADAGSVADETRRTALLGRFNRAAESVEPIIERRTVRAVSRAEQARNELEWVSLFVLLFSLSLAAAIFYSFAKSISAPIEKLKTAAFAVGKGDLNAGIEVQSSDEIGVLAGSFKEMVSNLLNLIDGVKRSGIYVTSSSTQIAAAAKQLEATVTEQAASTNQVVATAKQISATSRELANTMNAITSVAEGTQVLAQAGRTGLDDMATTMEALVEATRSITSRLAILSQKANNIGSVVTTISKVADQTNLLSLNAAIEAEKAGEYGLGFGVVASEIRRLADQTGASTLEIERMVKEMQSAVSAGVMSMDKFAGEVRKGAERVQSVGVQLGKIIEQVQTLAPRFEVVTEGMESQSLGAEQISESMIHLNEAAQQTAESVRDFNGITERLNEAAQALHAEVSRFKAEAL